jgi:hypothetical protein
MIEHAQLDPVAVLPYGITAQHIPWPQPATGLAQVGDVDAYVLTRKAGEVGEAFSLDPDPPHPAGDRGNLRDRAGYGEPADEPVAGAPGGGCG